MTNFLSTTSAFESEQLVGIEAPFGVRLLAYYLPQFHRTPENDAWHGQGFTEWTRVKAAEPLFECHNQPRIPHQDIGYYELTSIEVLELQARMMRVSGLSGAIFYHYRFGGGKKLLEAPARMLSENPDVDMPFCFAWCNENWTKRWDGGNHSILMEQVYSNEDASEFISEFLDYANDERYIKVDDRPVLIIYRPHLIPDIKSYIEIWKFECAARGAKFPYLVASETWGKSTSTKFLEFFDAVSEKPLYNYPDLDYLPTPDIDFHKGSHEGMVKDYSDVAHHYMNFPSCASNKVIPSISPSWDVTPRHGSKSLILVDAAPKVFGEWLRHCISRTRSLPQPERFVFINAWNEWAEGTYLEPDETIGYGYLNELARSTLFLQKVEK